MTRAHPLISNLVAGELSPLLMGRADLPRFGAGAAQLENFIALPQGPIARRPGTQFVAAPRGGERARLIPAVFAVDDAYVVEVTDGAMRFYKNRAPLMNGAAPYEIASPYAEAELDRLAWTQANDRVYLVHPDHPPRFLMPLAPLDWRLELAVFWDGPYLPVNTSDVTVAASATSGTVTLTASAALFDASHVGRPFRLNGGWGWVESVASATQAQLRLEQDLSTTDATTEWRETAWSARNGWPRAVTLHEQRLWFAATTRQPDALWASRTGRALDFRLSDPVVDDDALSFTLSSDRVDRIRWLASGRHLFVGAQGGEWSVVGAGTNAPIAPLNAVARRCAAFGVAEAQPEPVGGALLYAERGGGRLRELAWRYDEDSFASSNLSIAAEHALAPGGIAEMAFQASPVPVLWLRLGPHPDDPESGGELVGVTYDRDQKIAAFHRHPAEVSPALRRVEALCVIPGPGGLDDDLWLCVRRPAASGGFRRSIEVLRGRAKRPFHMDCAARRTGPLSAVVTGLAHLEGETVTIAAEGAAHPPRVVVGGQVILDAPAEWVDVGLGFVPRLVTMPIEAGAADGTAQTRVKALPKLRLRLLETVGGVAGPAGGRLDLIPMRSSAVGFGEAVPPFTGDVELPTPGGWGRPGQLEIRQPQPLPMTILALAPMVTLND